MENGSGLGCHARNLDIILLIIGNILTFFLNYKTNYMFCCLKRNLDLSPFLPSCPSLLSHKKKLIQLNSHCIWVQLSSLSYHAQECGRSKGCIWALERERDTAGLTTCFGLKVFSPNYQYFRKEGYSTLQNPVY